MVLQSGDSLSSSLDELSNESSASVAGLADAALEVTRLFPKEDAKQIEAARAAGAAAIEIHTGHYADAASQAEQDAEFKHIEAGVALGNQLGLVVNAGHGLHFDNTARIAALAGISELNIGHAIVAEAVFRGWQKTVRDMKALIIVSRGI